ncbi:uncharacterized protein [Leptinotarsa decemlineata]|uniref:uncharacterized protein n=1 Tax=Leptinotarsa decemlineata TaxID=7539 RepID=UPI003D308BA5
MTANANKIKQCRALQQICIDRMSDIAEIAEAAKTSVDLHSLFKSMCSHLENIYQDFEKHNAVLLPLLISVDEYDNEEFKVLSRGFYKHYYAAKSTFSQLFNTVDVVNNPSPPEMSHVRLPKIELVKFDGNFKQWKTFIDMFNSLVHDNSSLKNIDKFNYLISSLSGSPLALVKCNPISDANYIVAYNSLIKRYENKRLLANAHYLELENAPRIPDNNISSQNLRKLVDTFTENIAALKNLGFPTDQWSFLLFNMLVRRLDSNTVGRFEIEIGSDDIPTFDDLRDFVLKQSSALDRTFDCTQKKIPKPGIKARTHLQNSSSNFTPEDRFTPRLNK